MPTLVLHPFHTTHSRLRRSSVWLGVWTLLAILTSHARASDAPGLEKTLIATGEFAGAVVVRIDIAAKDIEEQLSIIVPVSDGKILESLAVPPGDGRTISIEALDAEQRVVMRGETVQNVDPKMTLPFEIELKPLTGDAKGTIKLASHRLTFDTLDEREGIEKGVQLVANLIDANGYSIPLSADEVKWNINDPFARERVMPCEAGWGPRPCIMFLEPAEFINAEIIACYRDIFCSAYFSSPFWRAISASWGEHACALARNKQVWCWGQDHYGELGVDMPADCEKVQYGDTVYTIPWKCSHHPVQVVCPNRAPCDFIAITTGERHTCAIDSQHDAWCWGDNSLGQLGLGSSTRATRGGPLPRRVLGGHKFASLSASWFSTCGVTTGGDVYCWGYNGMGVTGSPLHPPTTTPNRVAFRVAIRSVAGGANHMCAISTQSRMFCWGVNHFEVLAGTSSINVLPWCGNCTATPVLVEAGIPEINTRFVDTAAPAMNSTCAHVVSGETICWGALTHLQRFASPASMSINKLTGGADHYAGLIGNAAVGFGSGNAGDLGDAQFKASKDPVAALMPPFGYTEIDAGLSFVCGISISDQLYCWGRNEHGQLGDGTEEARGEPTAVEFK